jgi:hypothetical protein
MYTEIQLETASHARIAEEILALRNSEDALVIRSGKTKRLNRDDWVQLLEHECHMKPDRRHYSFEEELIKDQWWEISNQPNKETSYAYSTTSQPFHNDNAWFADPAEINFFVMEKQAASGGEQLIYPVSRLINDLQSYDPSLLEDLVSQPVTISKGDGEHQNITPIISLENGGRVFWNYYRISKESPVVDELCERFFAFLKQQEESASVYSIRCDSGDSLAFHDQRLLHARTAFTAEKPRDRVLYQSMWRLPSGPAYL